MASKIPWNSNDHTNAIPARGSLRHDDTNSSSVLITEHSPNATHEDMCIDVTDTNNLPTVKSNLGVGDNEMGEFQDGLCLTMNDHIKLSNSEILEYAPILENSNICIRSELYGITNETSVCRLANLKDDIEEYCTRSGVTPPSNTDTEIRIVHEEPMNLHIPSNPMENDGDIFPDQIILNENALPPGIRYHVFFCHADEDRKWVRDVLQKLEAPPYNMKCCYAGRDFNGGDPVTKNICDSLKASRKTVIVLSPDLLKSSWGEYEIRMTLEMDLQEHRRILIPVMLHPCHLPDYLEKLTYIDVENEHFWERFISAIQRTDTTSGDGDVSVNIGNPSLQLPRYRNMTVLAEIKLTQSCDCCSGSENTCVPNELTGSRITEEDYRKILCTLRIRGFMQVKSFCLSRVSMFIITPLVIANVLILCFGGLVSTNPYDWKYFIYGMIILSLLLFGILLRSVFVLLYAKPFSEAVREVNKLAQTYDLMIGFKDYGYCGCQCDRLTAIFYYYDWRLCRGRIEDLRSSMVSDEIVNIDGETPLLQGFPDAQQESETSAMEKLYDYVPEYVELFGKRQILEPVGQQSHAANFECLCQFSENVESERGTNNCTYWYFGVKRRYTFKQFCFFCDCS